MNVHFSNNCCCMYCCMMMDDRRGPSRRRTLELAGTSRAGGFVTSMTRFAFKSGRRPGTVQLQPAYRTLLQGFSHAGVCHHMPYALSLGSNAASVTRVN